MCRDELYKEDGRVVGQYMEEVKRAFGRAHDFTTGQPISIMPSTSSIPTQGRLHVSTMGSIFIFGSLHHYTHHRRRYALL